MTMLRLFVVLGIAAVVLVRENDASFLTDGQASGKLTRFLENSQNLADAYKHLVLDTPGSKARLVHCANEILQAFQSSLYGLNQGIASIKNKELHDSQCKIADSASEVAHNLQCELCGDAEKLKADLIILCEKFNEMSRKIAKDVQTHDCKNEQFFGNQLRRFLNMAIYKSEKIKLEIELGKKTSKELPAIMDAALQDILKCVPNIKKNDPKTKEELIYLIQNLELIGDFCIIELEKFVDINRDDHKNNAIVKEVAKGLNSACHGLQLLLVDDHDASEMLAVLENTHKHATVAMKKLCQVDAGENTPGDLLIRSVIIVNVAVSKFYERELIQLTK